MPVTGIPGRIGRARVESVMGSVLIAPQPPLSIALALIGALTLGTLNLRAPRLDGRQILPPRSDTLHGGPSLFVSIPLAVAIRAILFRARVSDGASRRPHQHMVAGSPQPGRGRVHLPRPSPGSRASPGTRIIAVMALGMLSSILIPC